MLIVCFKINLRIFLGENISFVERVNRLSKLEPRHPLMQPFRIKKKFKKNWRMKP